MTVSALDLATVTVEAFQGFVGQTFEVAAEEGGEVVTDFQLIEAAQKGSLPEGFRQPFSLIFEGPLDPALAQQTLWFSHSDLSSLPIFVVPVGIKDEKRLYQAIFS